VALVCHDDRPLMAAIERLMNRKVESRVIAGFEPGGGGQHRPAQEQPRHNQRPQRPQHRPHHQRHASGDKKTNRPPQQRPQATPAPRPAQQAAERRPETVQYPRTVSRG